MEEIWKDIQGYEGLYQISNLGRVKSFPRLTNRGSGSYITKERILKNTLMTIGYNRVELSINSERKFYSIHRLVAIHFIANPENKPQVNHINGIKHDNRIKNLEWCTAIENSRHAFKTGLHGSRKGEKHSKSKLKDTDIYKIKALLKNNISCKEISMLFSVSPQAISDIKFGRNWTHL